jgi:hypothetical protein
MSVAEQQATWIGFFDHLFAADTGYVCIAYTKPMPTPPETQKTWKQKFFEWPSKKQVMYDFIERLSSNYNLYFGVNVLSLQERTAGNCIPQNLVWADLDTCSPDQIEIPPQCVIESSPGRYQALWLLDRKIDPYLASNYSKRIAYKYAEQGADLSGHDLSQMLRIPGTYNFKYQAIDVPQVKLLMMAGDHLLPPELFESIEIAEEIPLDDITGIEMPTADDLPDPQSVVYAFRDHLKTTAFARYYSEEPNEDWSKSLWRLINTCCEVGMTLEETFSIARTSKCNKYARDGRPEVHLWREVIKAELQHKSIQAIIEDNRILAFPVLLSAKEEKACGKSIIAEYREWAAKTTDAVEEFHELSCAILLSALMSAGIRIPSSLPTPLVPNLWGLVLGDSTLTRKTTSMQMAMEFLLEIDHETVIMSDGSAEGLLSTVATRPKMVSMFFRDEITGFLDSIKKKDYLSAMPEILTQLYDVPKYLPRRLRKETITLIEPIFIFFGGGIKDKTFQLIEEEYFTSGFLPRFLVVSGITDLERIRRTGPPQVATAEERDALLHKFRELHTLYARTDVEVEVEGIGMVSLNREVSAILSHDAWERFALIEAKLISAAHDSPHAGMALPTFQRMGFSLLKLAALLAAARQVPNTDSQVAVEESDILESAYYIQKWGSHMVELIRNSGQGVDETRMRQIYRTVENHPGILRGQVMQRHHINARQMSDIQETMEQRLMIQVDKKGKATKYWPIGK